MVWITCLRAAARTKRHLRLCSIVCALVAAISGVAVPTAQAAPTAAIQNFTVSSTTGWQQTPISLQTGEGYALAYASGSWTVDYRNFPRVGPGGYSNAADAKIYQGCKYLPSSNYAVLLGSIGNGPMFAIGSGGTFDANAAGQLRLRINDDDACLGDNAGSVTMKIETEPPMVTAIKNYAGYSVGPLAGTDRYAVASWAVPTVTCSDAPGKTYTGRAAVWAGLWGSVYLVQAGTNSQCVKQTSGTKVSTQTSYYAWFELVPAGPQKLGMTVKHGDNMRAQVEYAGQDHGKLRFWYAVTDLTTKAQKSAYVDAPSGATLANSADQAGAVVEGLGMNGNLAKFSPITISNFGFGAAFNLLPALTQYQMGSQTCLIVCLVNDIEATPSQLVNESFTVSWAKYEL